MSLTEYLKKNHLETIGEAQPDTTSNDCEWNQLARDVRTGDEYYINWIFDDEWKDVDSEDFPYGMWEDGWFWMVVKM